MLLNVQKWLIKFRLGPKYYFLLVPFTNTYKNARTVDRMQKEKYIFLLKRNFFACSEEFQPSHRGITIKYAV
jgi:hypothetical protein